MIIDSIFSVVIAMIKQFLTDVVWGDVDYLIIDTPPGEVLCECTLYEVIACVCVQFNVLYLLTLGTRGRREELQ